MIDIAITNRQQILPLDIEPLRQACRLVLEEAGHDTARISLAVVDDAEMHALNRQHLEHDYPTDVLSFSLSAEGEPLEGEVIVSTETAMSNAQEYGSEPLEELLLYIVHGTLHLVGRRDKSPAEAEAMRSAEAETLGKLGISSDRVAALVYPDGKQPNSDIPLPPVGDSSR